MVRLGAGHLVPARAGFCRVDLCQPGSARLVPSQVVPRKIQRLSARPQGFVPRDMVMHEIGMLVAQLSAGRRVGRIVVYPQGY